MKNTERLKELAEEYGLTGEDFFKDKRGFVIITRGGVEKIQTRDSINITYEVITCQEDFVVIKAIATVEGARAESFGEASTKNCINKHFVAMAEKRAKARVVLQLTNFYQLGIYSESEVEKENGHASRS